MVRQAHQPVQGDVNRISLNSIFTLPIKYVGRQFSEGGGCPMIHLGGRLYGAVRIDSLLA